MTNKCVYLATALLAGSLGHAGTIYYTFTGAASGSDAGTPFVSAPFSIVAAADAALRVGTAPAYSLAAASATVVVGGFAMADFLRPMSVYVNGLFALNLAGKGTLFEGAGPADLITPGGPYGFTLFSHAGATQFNAVATSRGPLTFYSVSAGVMSVSLAAGAVPEPSTSVLAGAALAWLTVIRSHARRHLVRKRHHRALEI